MDDFIPDNDRENSGDDDELLIPEQLPLLPLRDVVLFTHMLLPLFVGRERSVRAIQKSYGSHRLVFLAAQSEPTVEDPGPADLHSVGTVAMIMRVLRVADGRLKVLVQGLSRARITRFLQEDPFHLVALEPVPETSTSTSPSEVEALMRTVRDQSQKILSLKGVLNPDVVAILNNIEDPGHLADLVASNLRIKSHEAQEILEITDPVQRLIHVTRCLNREMEVSAMQAKIQSEAKEEIGRMQRDYYLREQIRVIQKELGELDERNSESESYRRKIARARMSRQAKKEAERQLERLEQMHPDAAEATVIRSYLDWLVELPWNRSSNDQLNIREAKRILDEDHFNLEKVKDRILEFLSVRKLNPHMKGPILCFIGPPGTGKTSLGRSIARAMGRKFTRISIGGVRDEAEIRGHRRTYVGALPGRVIQGIKQCGFNNPVFMIDEVDKIGQDFRGDPSSALLEVLDPEQNRSFSDHYLNVAFDLSKVLFITTANTDAPIPAALLDRMEILRLSGYTFEEKTSIVYRHLLPRQLTENGISDANLRFSRELLKEIIVHYTQEAGLRNLEREIGTLCRKVARRIAEGSPGPFRLTRSNLHQYLGPPRYLEELNQLEDDVGVATGLAWTEAGGEVLYIEVSLMKGKGNLLLTGQLGEVMKESAQAAVSYARTRAESIGLDPDFHETMDIHIHVPAGAIPKDGPSAGVTMATALVSALSGKPVKRSVAMTGEVTLRGKVLPVGGIKEKVLAARRAGIHTILVPEKNRRDLSEIPLNLRRKLDLVLTSHMDQILEHSLASTSGEAPGTNPVKSEEFSRETA